MGLSVQPLAPQSSLSVVPVTSKPLANYAVAKSADGGWNYTFNGKPITREAYAAGGGQVQTDPSRTVAPPPGPPNSNGSSGGGTTYADKSGDIAFQNAGLASVDAARDVNLAGVNTALANLKGAYATEAANATGSYDTNSTQNQNNLQKTKQTALIHAAQGRQGLFGTLASLGALNGSGIDLANEAVKNGANEDLSTAGDTYATNQSGLDTAIKKFKDEDEARNKSADQGAANSRTNVQNDAAKNKQAYYKQLSDDYTAQGDPANAAKFAKMASDLFPAIAATSLSTAGLTRTAAAYTAPSLASYLNSANSTKVSTTPSGGTGGIPGLIASPIKKQQA